MSRIGKQPVPVPKGVTVDVTDGTVKVKGPKGEITLSLHPLISAHFEADKSRVIVERPDDLPFTRMQQGTMRSIIENMVMGVTQGYVKRLEIIGVGYQARLQGQELALVVGFSQPVVMPIPKGLIVEVPNPTHLSITGCDKQAVGEFAARVRKVRPPEPFKGKGIRYVGEVVRRKAGKAFVGGE